MSNKSIYLAKSRLADVRIVKAIEKYLTESGYTVLKYTGGQYDEKKEEAKMSKAESMIVVPGLQHEFAEYRKSRGVSYNAEALIGKGLQSQIESFQKVNSLSINVVLSVDMETAIEENNFDDIEEIINVCILENYSYQPKHKSYFGFEFGNWIDTFSLLELDADTENTLDEAYPVSIDCVKPIENLVHINDIDKHDYNIVPMGTIKKKKEVNYLLMASIL